MQELKFSVVRIPLNAHKGQRRMAGPGGHRVPALSGHPSVFLTRHAEPFGKQALIVPPQDEA